jgi:serine/threonine protein phosphatase PrpC
MDEAHDLESLRSTVLDGIEAANRAVQALGTGAATTLAAVEFREGTIRPYHIGDSTILLVGNRGKVKLQTRSHAPVAYGVEAGLIHEDDAIHHEDLHLVSNVVGTDDTHIEIGSERKMSARDTLLVASDGLFDNLYLEEIVEIVRKGALRQAAHKLVEKAYQRMVSPKSEEPSKPDDLTFVLFRRGSEATS